MAQEDARAYVDDIKLHVYEMAHLPKDVRECFKSDMRIVVDYLAEGADYEPSGQKIKHLEALLLLLEALTGDVRYSEIVPEMLEQERKGGTVTMCELIDKYEKRGKESAILASIKNLMKNLKLTVNQAMEALEIPKEEQEKYLRLMS